MNKFFLILALAFSSFAGAQTNAIQGQPASSNVSSGYNVQSVPHFAPAAAPSGRRLEDVCLQANGRLNSDCMRSFEPGWTPQWRGMGVSLPAQGPNMGIALPVQVAQGPNMQNCQQSHAQNCAPVQSQIRPSKDPLTNPDAVPHRIDRSAMEIQIQGWTRDLRYPVYPIAVMNGANGVYYTTNENVKKYHEYDFDELRCEIGDADKSVLSTPGYACADGVCMSKEGAILGTDPRKKSKKRTCH